MNRNLGDISNSPEDGDSQQGSTLTRSETDPEALQIPKLTELVKSSDDPDLVPMLHLNRVYPYPATRRLVVIPAFSHSPQIVRRLPGVDMIEQHI